MEGGWRRREVDRRRGKGGMERKGGENRWEGGWRGSDGMRKREWKGE